MAYSEDLYIYKETHKLCKILLDYSKNVSKIIRFGQYGKAIDKAFAALDLVRRINSSFDGREENLRDFVLLLSEVRSRITLFAESQYLSVKQATNLTFQIEKVMKDGYGWLKSERKRKGEN